MARGGYEEKHQTPEVVECRHKGPGDRFREGEADLNAQLVDQWDLEAKGETGELGVRNGSIKFAGKKEKSSKGKKGGDEPQ